jgi:pyruvate,water dikinase
MIEKANKLKRKVGLCGQAPSDSKEFTRLIVTAGIDSISFNPDALINGINNINETLSSPIKSTKTGNPPVDVKKASKHVKGTA